MRDDYQMAIQCPVKPAKIDSALVLMKEGLDDVSKNGVTKDELDKVITFELKEFANNQKKNEYWTGLILNKTLWGKDNRTGYEETLKSVTPKDVQDFVNNVLLKQRNCVTVTMCPTDLTETDGTK